MVDVGTPVPEVDGWTLVGSTLSRVLLGESIVASHWSLDFSAFGVARESSTASGTSVSDSRYGCRKAGVRGIVGDLIEVLVETLEFTRCIDELAEDGEPDLDSGREGSWSRFAFEEVLAGR